VDTRDAAGKFSFLTEATNYQGMGDSHEVSRSEFVTETMRELTRERCSSACVAGAQAPAYVERDKANRPRRLGIAVSHSWPYHPETPGKDERFHGTLEHYLGRQPPRPELGV